MPAALAAPWAGTFIETCKASLGGVNLKLAVSDSVSLQAQVEVQTLDMAVVYEDEPAPAFARQLLFRQRLYLIYPQAKAKPAISITLSELAALPLILPSPPNVTRNAVDAAFKAAALTPNVVAEVDDLSSILASIRTGFGSTVCPKGDFP
jgi:LysR family nitrogen assimilation transcriptional regulator